MAQNENSISDDAIIRMQAIQLIAMRNEQPCLRDQFAMAALTGLISGSKGIAGFEPSDAIHAYRWADAMMEARKPKPRAIAIAEDAGNDPYHARDVHAVAEWLREAGKEMDEAAAGAE